MKRIAVIGSGISGLSAAWLLRHHCAVTLFEANDYLGGHTNTVDVTLEGITAPVDTGFLVHNDLTYPHLIALFKHLNIATHPTDMSFSVAIPDLPLEWAGTDLGSVFAQKRNLLRPAFWRMLRDILRFNRNAKAHLQEATTQGWSLRQLLDAHGYRQSFRDWYLIPMAAAIWSSPAREILEFPAQTFITFCLNHHLLQINDRPQWKTVINGARTYVAAMASALEDIRLNCPVLSVRRTQEGVILASTHGEERFDEVIFACHAPTTLRLLKDASEHERSVLQAFRYQPNVAILHTDERFLPGDRRTWAAWNYQSGPDEGGTRPVCVSYLINKLQPLPFSTPVIVTLNPYRLPAPEKTLRTIEYEHPLFDAMAVAAQSRLADIQGQHRAWFCGAWAGYGFHEDGLKSAVEIVRQMGVTIPWQGDAA
jgi:predicted NAD/FAD-binding protein